jgi:nucleotide-binding universal stress UspA family protein
VFRNILVPLDGSDLAERVVRRVLPWRDADATLHLVRVIPGGGPELTPFEEALSIEAESYLDFIAADVGGAVRKQVRRGAVADEVLAAAKAANADLIALSTHGESGVSRFVFGSTAERVVRSSPCPVMVVAASQSMAPPVATLERIVVALDGTADSESALGPARPLALDHAASLLLLTVVESLWAAGDSALARVQAKEVRKTHDRLRQLAGELSAAGVKARPLLSRGDPAAEILSQVDRRRADLLCMSTHARGTVGRWFFGSVAEEVLKSVRVPVLLVRRSTGTQVRPA